MHLSLWYVVLVCQQYDVCENYVGNVYIIGGYGGLSESEPVSFLVVGECPSVLLLSVVMPYVNCDFVV